MSPYLKYDGKMKKNTTIFEEAKTLKKKYGKEKAIEVLQKKKMSHIKKNGRRKFKEFAYDSIIQKLRAGQIWKMCSKA